MKDEVTKENISNSFIKLSNVFTISFAVKKIRELNIKRINQNGCITYFELRELKTTMILKSQKNIKSINKGHYPTFF